MKNEKERIIRSGIFPNREQAKLLKACLLKGTDSIDAFYEWLEIVNIPFTTKTDKSIGLPQFFDKLDLGSQRLLPMLYKNMKANKVNHPLISKLEGYYKHIWYRNHILMAELKKIITLLSAKNIEVITRKGLYMTVDVYKDYGTRPTVDIDITIRKENWEETILVLENNGWKPHSNQNQNPYRMNFSQFHAFTLVNNDFQLDVHYDFVNYNLKKETKKLIWKNTNNSNGFSFLSKPDELFFTLIHGFQVNYIIPQIRWVADCVLLFRQFNEVDWGNFDKLLYLENKKSAFIMLEYLQSNQFISFPDRIKEQLNNKKNIKFDLLEKNILTQFYFSDFHGFINLCSRIYISNSRSLRKSIIQLSDHYLFRWDKKYYFEVIPHAFVLFSNKVFRSIVSSKNK